MKLVTLKELKVGDTFRYIGSEEDDWHTVSAITEEKLYYPGYFADRPESNHRVDNVSVILKEDLPEPEGDNFDLR